MASRGLGPLDRWLRRPQPLEQTQLQSENAEDDRDQRTAEPPATSEQEQQQQEQQRKRGTLQAYFSKTDAEDDSQQIEDITAAPHKRRRHPCSTALEWQLTGHMHLEAAALLHHRHAATFRQHAILETHAWQRPVLGGTPISPEEAGSIQTAQFDSQGELLVTGSEEGLITVQTSAQLLAACPPQALSGSSSSIDADAPFPAAQQHVGTADPLLVLDTHMPKLQAVRWNAADENVVGVVSSATRQLHLYDLQHTQGQPKQVLTIPQQSASAAVPGSTAVGLTDLAFFGSGSGTSSPGNSSGGSGGYLVLASGQGGQVFLWDARAKSAPSATLTGSAGGSGRSGALYAAALAPDQQVVLAGSQSGEVKMWDLRGGSSSTLRFGGTVHHHPLLGAVNIRYALTGVPGLASQTSIPASAVHSMQLDPTDPRRLGFHLGCGWSGVLDLHSSTITHLHAPAHATYADEPPALGGSGVGSAEDGSSAAASVAQMLLWASTAVPGLHRQACWMHDGRRFCVPSRRQDALLLLDFSPSPSAGCYALQEEQDELVLAAASFQSSSSTSGGSGSQQHRAVPPPPAVHVPLTQAAVCAAAHPRRDLLVAGSMNSCLSVAGLV